MTIWHVTIVVPKSSTASDVYRCHAAKFGSDERDDAVLQSLDAIPPADYNPLIIVPEYFH